MDYTDLKREVWDTLKCFGCGACAGVCPADIIEFKGGDVPEVTGECTECGLCTSVCPGKMSDEECQEIATSYGDCSEIGHIRRRYFARSTDFEIIKRSQSLGVASTILKHVLETGFVDAAIVVSADERMRSKTVIARSYDDLKKSSKVKYIWAPVLEKLREVAKDKSIESVAIIGTPCVIQAVRRIERSKLNKLKKKIKLTIGLFCWEIFRNELIHEMLLRELKLDIDPRRIWRLSIKRRTLYVELVSGEEYAIPLEVCAKYARVGCSHCTDFTNEWADLSIGDAGAAKDYLTVLTRTDVGERLFSDLIESGKIEVGRFSESTFAIVKDISRKKKQRSAQGIAAASPSSPLRSYSHDTP